MIHLTPSSEVARPGDLEAPGLALLALRAAEHDVLVVVGEADIATAQVLHDLVLRALPDPPRPVVLELGALAFCGLHGVDALRDIAREARAAGVVLDVRGQSPQLEWLLRTVPAADGRRGRPAPRAEDRDRCTADTRC